MENKNHPIENQFEILSHITDFATLFKVTDKTEFILVKANSALLANSVYSKEDKYGHQLDDIYPEGIASHMKKYFIQAVQTKSKVRFQCSSRFEQLLGETEITPILDDEGRCSHLLLITKDETEQQRLAHYYQSFLDSTDDAVLVAEPDGRIVQVNQAFEEIFKFSKEEVMGLTVSEYPFISYEYKKETIEMMEYMKKHPVPIKEETQRLRKDGALVTVNMTVCPILDRHQRVMAYFSCYRDITQKKLWERRKTISEERYKSLFERSPNAIYSFDLEGNFISANPALERLTGYTTREILNHNLEMFTVESDVEKVWEYFNLAKQGEAVEYELSIYNRAKEVIHLICSSFPIVTEGNIVGVYGVAVDVTESKKAKKELEDSKERYQKLVDLSPETILVHHLGTIEYINESGVKLLGAQSAEELIGRSVLDFLDEKHYDIVKERMAHMSTEGNKAELLEETIIRLDGKKVDVEVVGVGIHNQGKSSVQLLIRDITTRKNTLKALKESEKQYRDLAELSPEPVLVYQDGVFVYVNPAAVKLAGAKSKEDLLGKPISTFIHSSSNQEVLKRMNQLKEGGMPPQSQELQFVNLQGKVVDCEITSFKTVYQGKPSVQVLFRDITERKQKERELKRQNQLLQALFRSTHEAIMIFDTNGKMIQANEEVESVFGWKPEELIGLEHSEFPFIPKELKPDANQNYQTNAHGKSIFDKEVPRIRKDGKQIICSTNHVAVKDEEGNVIALATVVRDITGIKETEQKLKELNEKLELVLHSAPVAIWTVTYPEEKFLYVSQGVERVYGVTVQDFYEGRVNFERMVHPEDKERVGRIHLSPVDGQVTEVDYRIIRPDGEIEWIKARIRPTMDEKEGLILTGVVVSITENKKAEFELQKSKEQYQMLVELSPEPIIVHSNGRIVYTNPAALEMVGIEKKEELIGKEVLSIVHPDSYQSVMENIVKVLRGEVVDLTEVKYMKTNGEVIHARSVEMPIEYNGEPSVVLVFRDITAQKQKERVLLEYEERLKESEERYKSLFEHTIDAIISMDLNGKCTMVNPVVETLTGYSKKELVGKLVFSLIPQHQLEKAYEYFSKVEKGIAEESIELILMKKGGSQFTVEAKGIPILVNGKTIGIYIIAKDISCQKGAEKKIGESEQKYRSLFERNPNPIFTLDLDGYIINKNNSLETMLGVTTEEPLHFRNYVKPHDLLKAYEHFEKAKKGVPQTYEVEITTETGEDRSIRVSNFPMIVNNKIVGVFGTIHNIIEAN